MIDMIMKALMGGGMKGMGGGGLTGGGGLLGGIQGALNAAPDSMARQQQGGGLGMAAQQPSAPAQPAEMFGGSVPAGNGGMSGPLPGLGGFGAMPSESGNFNMVFGRGPMGPAPMQAGQGGQGLQQLLPILLKVFGGGI